jgi:hypothetical protein
VARIAKAGGKAHYLNHDVRDEAAWPAIVAEAEKRFGRLDIMVANAGIGIMSPIATMTLADWQKQQAINLDGVFLSIKHAIPAMKRQGGGSIVLMSSVAGLLGSAGQAAYGVANVEVDGAVERLGEMVRRGQEKEGGARLGGGRRQGARGAGTVAARRRRRRARPCPPLPPLPPPPPPRSTVSWAASTVSWRRWRRGRGRDEGR